MAPVGLEPDRVTTENTNHLANQTRQDLARSGAVGAQSGAIDPDLQQVINTWSKLTDADKNTILAIVTNAGSE